MADFRKTLESEDGERRAVILRRPDGKFQIDFERWDGSQVTGIGGLSDPFWHFTADDRQQTRLTGKRRKCFEALIQIPFAGFVNVVHGARG